MFHHLQILTSLFLFCLHTRIQHFHQVLSDFLDRELFHFHKELSIRLGPWIGRLGKGPKKTIEESHVKVSKDRHINITRLQFLTRFQFGFETIRNNTALKLKN